MHWFELIRNEQHNTTTTGCWFDSFTDQVVSPATSRCCRGREPVVCGPPTPNQSIPTLNRKLFVYTRSSAYFRTSFGLSWRPLLLADPHSAAQRRYLSVGVQLLRRSTNFLPTSRRCCPEKAGIQFSPSSSTNPITLPYYLYFLGGGEWLLRMTKWL